jgi:hypothetical protein
VPLRRGEVAQPPTHDLGVKLVVDLFLFSCRWRS